MKQFRVTLALRKRDPHFFVRARALFAPMAGCRVLSASGEYRVTVVLGLVPIERPSEVQAEDVATYARDLLTRVAPDVALLSAMAVG